MHEDFDAFLRDSAPDHLVREDHRRQLKLVLLGKVKRKRERIALPLAGVFTFIVVLTLATGKSDLGSNDFRLHPIGSDEPGSQEFRAEVGGIHIAVDNPNQSETEQKGLLEEVIEREFALEEVLQAATGWTVGGTTFFLVDYAYQLDGEDKVQSRFSNTPDVVPTPDQFAFILKYRYDALKAIQTERAVFAGTEEGIRNIDGVPLRFKKWTVVLLDQDELICWIGRPIE